MLQVHFCKVHVRPRNCPVGFLLSSPLPPMSDQLHWRRRAFAESALSRHIAGEERGESDGSAPSLYLSSVSGGERRSSSENRRSLNINRSSALFAPQRGNTTTKAKMHSRSTHELPALSSGYAEIARLITIGTIVFTVFTSVYKEIGAYFLIVGKIPT